MILLVSDGVDSIQLVLDLRERLTLSDPAAHEINEEAIAAVNAAKHFPFDKCLGCQLEFANQNSNSMTLKDAGQFLFADDFIRSGDLGHRREDDALGWRKAVPDPFKDVLTCFEHLGYDPFDVINVDRRAGSRGFGIRLIE